MITDEELAQAGEIVAAWQKYWLLEGRLEGKLDRRAYDDLVERVAGAISRKDQKPARKAKAKAE